MFSSYYAMSKIKSAITSFENTGDKNALFREIEEVLRALEQVDRKIIDLEYKVRNLETRGR